MEKDEQDEIEFWDKGVIQSVQKSSKFDNPVKGAYASIQSIFPIQKHPAMININNGKYNTSFILKKEIDEEIEEFLDILSNYRDVNIGVRKRTTKDDKYLGDCVEYVVRIEEN